jgi:pimeloyl-ACP methyl ester carboxylesterase
MSQLKSCRMLIGTALVALSACGTAHQQAVSSSAASAPASSAPVATRFAPSADGVSVAWHQYGHGDPAVVLIHGWAASSAIWRAQLAALSSRYTVVTVDLAGQGESGSHREVWSLSNYAQDVAAVVAMLPKAHIILVGDGLGGPVVLEAAPRIGARVTGIIGVETFRTLGQPAPPPSQIDQALQPFRSDFAGTVRRYVAGTLFHAQADPNIVRSVADLMAQSAPERGLASLNELNKLDYGSILPAVKARLVVIDSDLGGAVDEARLHRVAPQLRLVSLPGDDSFPMLDDAPRFNSALLQAIDSLAAQ